jgi:integrase/recombinase XerC
MAHAKIITDTNLRAVQAVLKNSRERGMVLLSLKAGLRAIEIAGLTWGCVRDDDTLLELVSTKGGKPRTVPVNRDLREALRAYRAECKRTGDDDYVFRARHAKPGEPLTANAVAAWFRDLYTRRLGWTGYSSHSGRRTFATQAARKATTVGGSLRDVQDMLGHASLNTTQRYLEPSSDAKRKLVELV